MKPLLPHWVTVGDAGCLVEKFLRKEGLVGVVVSRKTETPTVSIW